FLPTIRSARVCWPTPCSPRRRSNSDLQSGRRSDGGPRTNMHRLISRLVLLAALSLIVGGCGNNPSDAVVAPQPPTLTATLSGTLTLNGAAAFPFTVTGSGTIQAQLTTLSPDSNK